ncbi:MAG TPA: phage/plasmid replication protein, partial [Lutibacter sp.]
TIQTVITGTNRNVMIFKSTTKVAQFKPISLALTNRYHWHNLIRYIQFNYHIKETIMIDTIKGYINLNQYKYQDFEDLIIKGSKTIKENCYTISFNLSNFKVTIKFDLNNNPLTLFFNGSLPKFFFGNNLTHLNKNTTLDAVQMLSDNLNVDMSKAILTRVDFGFNLEVDYSVHQYISCLVSFPRLEMMRFKDSVTFFTKSDYKSLIFYDKLKEIRAKDKETYNSLSSFYLDKNILRYELQLKKSLKRRLDLDKVLLKDLCSDTVQNKLLSLWVKSYHKVQKLSMDIDPIHLLKSHNGLYKYLAFHGADSLGYERLSNTISELQFNVKNSSVKRSKMKSTLNELLKNVRENALDKNLVGELDDKINAIID